MEDINSYIDERLRISSKHPIENGCIEDFNDLIIDVKDEDVPEEYADEEYPETPTRLLNKGNDLMWWKWWKILAYNGPTTKKNLNKVFGIDDSESFSTIYVRMKSLNIITFDKENKCCIAQPVSKWDIRRE